jgi:hypothetical protein
LIANTLRLPARSTATSRPWEVSIATGAGFSALAVLEQFQQ